MVASVGGGRSFAVELGQAGEEEGRAAGNLEDGRAPAQIRLEEAGAGLVDDKVPADAVERGREEVAGAADAEAFLPVGDGFAGEGRAGDRMRREVFARRGDAGGGGEAAGGDVDGADEGAFMEVGQTGGAVRDAKRGDEADGLGGLGGFEGDDTKSGEAFGAVAGEGGVVADARLDDEVVHARAGFEFAL